MVGTLSRRSGRRDLTLGPECLGFIFLGSLVTWTHRLPEGTNPRAFSPTTFQGLAIHARPFFVSGRARTRAPGLDFPRAA